MKSKGPTPPAPVKVALDNLFSSVAAEEKFRQLYPRYSPKEGMRGFLKHHWSNYVGG